MKFGDNLGRLSIPEWKPYNLDYNEIKSQIKLLTRTNQEDHPNPHLDNTDAQSDSTTGQNTSFKRRSRKVTLKSLQDTFIRNFNYVDLFIITKKGELERKLSQNQKAFNKLSAKLPQLGGHSIPLIDHQIQLNNLHYQVLEISRVLRNLNRFIIIQKIACNKIFKKFAKYYSNEDVSSKFIHNLKTYLSTNPRSFVRIELTNLTLELSYFLDCITDELKRLESVSEDTNINRRNSKNSLFSDKSNTSVASTSPNSFTPYSKLIESQPYNRLHPQQIPTTKNLKFDLDILIRKNFQINCLIADNHNLNDVLLNLHVLLNCESLNDETELRRRNSSSSFASAFSQRTNGNSGNNSNNSLIAITYLTEKLSSGEDLNASCASSPARIISQFNQPISILISHVGGLRKDAYCILPNDVLQLVLNHLIHPNDPEILHSLQLWFSQNETSPLTKMAIDWVLNKKLKPTLKTIFKRSRYIIRKAEEDLFSNESTRPTGMGIGADHDSAALLSEEQGSGVVKKFEDSFLINLDQDIVTTNTPVNVQTLAFDIRLQDFENDSGCITELSNDESFDIFPFHQLSISSNDSTLSEFKTNMNQNHLTNQVDHDPILDNPNARYLKRMPLKIQQLLSLNAVNLINGELNFYFYMLSCYYNKLPPGDYQNSHFMNLLTLNLLKTNERGEQNDFATKMFEKKTRQVLRTQTSLRSIKLVSESNSKQQRIEEEQVREEQRQKSYPNLHQYYSAYDSSQFRNQLHTPTHNHTHAISPNPNQYHFQNQNNITVPTLTIKDEELTLLRSGHHDTYGTNLMYRNYPEDNETRSHSTWNGFFDMIVRFAAKINSKLPGGRQLDLERGMNFSEYYMDEDDMDEDDNEDDMSSVSSSVKELYMWSKYEHQYRRNYDEILSIIYFLFFFTSLFISGIIIGIVYSLIELSTEDTKFLVEDNIILIAIIFGGLLLSLIFSLVSINLNQSRYKQGPLWHTIVVWTGSAIVAASFIWTTVLLFKES